MRPQHKLRGATAFGASITALALLLVACGNPTQEVTTCTGTKETVIAAISERLEPGAGTLRNVKQVAASGVTFISAELHARSDARQDKGDILTWATRNPKRGTFLAVDEHARVNSTWPRSTFDVRKSGAYASRACADISRGKTRAQIACEQEQRDANAPAIGVDKNCDSL